MHYFGASLLGAIATSDVERYHDRPASASLEPSVKVGDAYGVIAFLLIQLQADLAKFGVTWWPDGMPNKRPVYPPTTQKQTTVVSDVGYQFSRRREVAGSFFLFALPFRGFVST